MCVVESEKRDRAIEEITLLKDAGFHIKYENGREFDVLGHPSEQEWEELIKASLPLFFSKDELY